MYLKKNIVFHVVARHEGRGSSNQTSMTPLEKGKGEGYGGGNRC